MQLDLFKPHIEVLEEEFLKLKAQQDNLRRGIFARFESLKKELCSLQEEVKMAKKVTQRKETE